MRTHDSSSRLQSLAHAAVLACVAWLAGCAPDPESPLRTLALSDCRLPRLATAARCGTLPVPENRAAPEGRKVELFVAVLPANTTNPKPDPLLILAGGPGQAASRLAPFASRLTEVRRTRDIVLIDQRGTGRSSPLACDAFSRRDEPLVVLETDPIPKARACAAELASRNIDLAQYTTAAWIADLESIREALGYRTFNLWGGSYGTRVALEYLRLHPDRVRSATLDGVAPPDFRIPLDVWPSRERALDAVFAACETQPECRKRYPELQGVLARIVAELAPDGREIRVADPRTGAATAHTLTGDALLAGLLPLTYAPELASLLPEVIGRASAGDYGPLFAAAGLVSEDFGQEFNAALHYAITCNEDAPRITADDRRLFSGLRTRALAERVLAVCDVWPHGRADAISSQPIASAIPVLILSGGLDPVTPPENGERVSRTLPNSRHVVARGYGHIVSPHACGPRLIAAFVDDAGFDRLPADCVRDLERSVRPPLWSDRFEARP